MLNTSTIGRVSAGEDLSLEEMSAAIDSIMRGGWTDDEIALFLNALRLKEETVDEIAGAALAMRKHMTPVRSMRTPLVDTCGTGGVGSEIFNVSTAAAIVTAAAGIPVAKHGNRSITSRSGSADVLRCLGVNIEASVPTVERCLHELGLCFCFAPLLHPAMKHVAAARKKLGVRTIFNLLGPLCNPASAPFQVMGVGRDELRSTMAEVLQRLGTRKAIVVTGCGGLGEITVAGPTSVSIVGPDSRQDSTWQPSDFNCETSALDSIKIERPEDSARIIREVVGGKTGAARDIVIVNAAAAIWVAGVAASLSDAAQQAARAIDSGAASELLARIACMTTSP